VNLLKGEKMRLNNLSEAKIEAEPITPTKPVLTSLAKNPAGNDEMLRHGRKSYNNTWELRGCPRCHGDIFLDSEDGDLLEHCLQCGYVGLAVMAGKSPQASLAQ
jgi:hypothetical protein